MTRPMAEALLLLRQAGRLDRLALGYGLAGKVMVGHATMDALARRDLARIVPIRAAWRSRCIGWATLTEEGARHA